MDTPLLPRHLGREIDDALRSARVVNVIGPRQAGKTTLVRDLLGRGRFITLDDP
ncbi:MAG TPA: ATP-binding protein, partial [Myxococcota bacterium]|nr:ATP-binding protein [Myxococcota bacterium]